MAVKNSGSVFLALSGGLLLAASDIKVANAMIYEGMASVGMAPFSAHPSWPSMQSCWLAEDVKPLSVCLGVCLSVCLS